MSCYNCNNCAVCGENNKRELDLLQSRIAELENQVRINEENLKKSIKDHSDLSESLSLAVMIINIFGEALEFYAEDNNYGDGDEDTTSPGGWYVTGSIAGSTGSEWFPDKGILAKAALGASEEELEGSLLAELLGNNKSNY